MHHLVPNPPPTLLRVHALPGYQAFWTQEFFAEEEQDVDYHSEPEPEDVIDSDFDHSESEEDSDGEKEVRRSGGGAA
jgi:hypothetical protein